MALVLTLRPNRELKNGVTIITPSGEEITVRVLPCGLKAIRVGIDAPQDYVILRDELKEDRK